MTNILKLIFTFTGILLFHIASSQELKDSTWILSPHYKLFVVVDSSSFREVAELYDMLFKRYKVKDKEKFRLSYEAKGYLREVPLLYYASHDFEERMNILKDYIKIYMLSQKDTNTYFYGNDNILNCKGSSEAISKLLLEQDIRALCQIEKDKQEMFFHYDNFLEPIEPSTLMEYTEKYSTENIVYKSQAYDTLLFKYIAHQELFTLIPKGSILNSYFNKHLCERIEFFYCLVSNITRLSELDVAIMQTDLNSLCNVNTPKFYSNGININRKALEYCIESWRKASGCNKFIIDTEE